jgi:hypothetical protein
MIVTSKFIALLPQNTMRACFPYDAFDPAPAHIFASSRERRATMTGALNERSPALRQAHDDWARAM